MKNENYITIMGWMRNELDLSGNELICYALIYGFTQDSETEFNGSLNYVANALGVTKSNASRIIGRLADKGLVEKRDIIFSGVRFCKYVAKRNPVVETTTPLPNQQQGVIKTATTPVVETATNNNIDNNNSIDIAKSDGAAVLFPEPEIKVEKKRKTSEPLCLFADSRYNRYEDFAACFTGAEYSGIDIAFYYGAVADWSAQSAKKKNDWIATARNFMRSDNEKNKLHKLAETQVGPDDSWMRVMQRRMDLAK